MADTIVAVATANGVGAISIVRMSGDDVLSIAQKHIKTSLTPRFATLTTFYDQAGDVIDMPLVLFFKAPFSFSGEDIVEFQCHGGLAVTRLILNALLDSGARLADAGEFTKRAYLNGKIDLTQAEAISNIIETKSEEGAKLLSKQLRGDLGRFVNTLRDSLIEILAYSEVTIDYAEEDLPQDIAESILKRLEEIAVLLEKSYHASKKREGMLSGYKIAIIGKPNVGKSSLLNNLLNDSRAIVSDIAGTTRDTIEEDIQIGTHIVRIVDTAGIRHEASDEIERIGIERSRQAIEECDIVIAMFDASRECDEEDEAIFSLLKETQKEILIVHNKTDLTRRFFTPHSDQVIELSQKESIEVLEKTLENLLDSYHGNEDIVLTSKRQVDAVFRAKEAINESARFVQTGELELFSFTIQEAIESLSSITKKFEHDEMLDKMFSSFCVGK